MKEYMVYFVKNDKKLRKKVTAFSSKEAQQRIIAQYGNVRIDGCKKIDDNTLNNFKSIFGFK